MTIRCKALNLAAGVFITLALLPSTAYLQDKTESPSQPQETVPAQTVPQQPGQLITPEDATATDLEDIKVDQEAVTDEGGQLTEPEEAAAAPSKEEAAYYTIKKGDTLWDISSSFLKDPFLWPFIWKANPSIANPDLIYPGNKLAIPNITSIERAFKTPATGEPQEKLVEKSAETPQPKPRSRESIAAAEIVKPKPVAPAEETPAAQSKLILPEEQQVPIIDKYAMLSAGFVNSDEMDGRIIGSPEDSKTAFGFGDIVYVKVPSAWNANIADKFLIYSPQQKVSHPKRGGRYGRLIRGLGILQITAKDSTGVLTAKITLSFDSIEKDNMLTPYQEPALVFDSAQKKSKNISGYILEVTDNRYINGQLDFVYIDKGSRDGVEPGDRFVVYDESTERSLPRKRIGEVQVFIVKDQSSTAVVRKSTEPISRGNQMEFLK
jgi:hypothetical protein